MGRCGKLGVEKVQRFSSLTGRRNLRTVDRRFVSCQLVVGGEVEGRRKSKFKIKWFDQSWV
jgi:hypothetical protein